MKQLIKISNGELSYRLNLNYNNVYSRLRMILGSKSSLFADISIKSNGATWYADDEADYLPFSEVSQANLRNALSVALGKQCQQVRKELAASPELVNYIDDILEVPDGNFIFYRATEAGYKLVLAGWGCKYSHQGPTEQSGGFIKHITSKDLVIPEIPKKSGVKKVFKDDESTVSPDDKPLKPEPENHEDKSDVKKEERKSVHEEESEKETDTKKSIDDKPSEKPKIEKKTQKVTVRVLDQNNNLVIGEMVNVRTSGGEVQNITSDTGCIELGLLPYGDNFGISFPNIPGNQIRNYEVEPNVEMYEAFVKKLHKYSPVLFIEDLDGNAVMDYNVKVVVNGKDFVYNSGNDGVIQLPTMQEGQKFIVIDTANYANTEEYNVTQAEAKMPYHFHIKRTEKTAVGVTVFDKIGNPLPQVSVNLSVGDIQCNQTTDEKGRTEFPFDVFTAGNIPVELYVKGKGKIKSVINFTPDVTEYTIQLHDKKAGVSMANWKWLALLPLLLLLTWGGYEVYNYLMKRNPTIKEMETGVVLIKSDVLYYVDFDVDGVYYTDGTPSRYYFTYDENSKKYGNFTRNREDIIPRGGWGTGFLISKDGLIATNRHVADPIPPKEAAKIVKDKILAEKKSWQSQKDSLDDELRSIGPLRKLDEYSAQYKQALEMQKNAQNQINIREQQINLGEFNVEVECSTSVAFVNSIIENTDDFIGCSFRASGEPGGVMEKDVAIIQLKKKDRDVPKGAYIFEVPEKDLMDEDIRDNYDITVLGYNAGTHLANIHDGIHPQAQPGKITIKTEKYRIGYNASIIGGSSGSPVLNKEGQLVAVNNSGLPDTQGFNYGIRTKYLRELLDTVLGKDGKMIK